MRGMARLVDLKDVRRLTRDKMAEAVEQIVASSHLSWKGKAVDISALFLNTSNEAVMFPFLAQIAILFLNDDLTDDEREKRAMEIMAGIAPKLRE